MSEEKNRIRESLLDNLPQTGIAPEQRGKIAELLRRNSEYRQARQIYCTPDIDLDQIRINTLLDGKELLMPAPGLKQGFYRIKPFSVPFPELYSAVNYKGVSKFGEIVQVAEFSKVAIDLVVCAALGIDPEGRRIGGGTGYFDLAMAILEQLGGLRPDILVMALAGEKQLLSETLPEDPWDVAVDCVLTPQGERCFTQKGRRMPGLFWDALSEKSIRKNDLLWYLRKKTSRIEG
ncbi:5-formyltetrahydrofolate cyclo-ligase [Thermodesulfobacteriota bacterium]